ncbi:MAG: hypothetical protein JST39_17225 [Bacteroidetes bacterium]|nr:hypothetical protein [Bacteroidota bacterium]
MKPIHANIELISSGDLVMVRRGYIKNDEVKRLQVDVLVDTSVSYFFINQYIKEYLDLSVYRTETTELPDGRSIKCKVAGPMNLRFKNRQTSCDAMVLPGDSMPILGSIALLAMNVAIDSVREELVVQPERLDLSLVKARLRSLCPVYYIDTKGQLKVY